MSALPRRTRAAVLVALEEPLVLAELELPGDLEAGQVLVRVRASGICGSQLGEIDGVKGADRFLPHLLGHEGVGEVLAVGPGVKHVQPGQTAVMHWRKGAGIEAAPARYLWEGRPVNAGWVTTFNEHAVVSENRLTPVPADTDPEVATLMGCAVTTGFGVVENNAQLRIGESIVVFGAGGIGLSVIQAAAMRSAHPIVAVDLHPEKLELARAMGATHVVDAGRQDAFLAIAAALDGAGVDCFVDNTGIPAIIEGGYRATKAQGRVVLVGVPRRGADISIHSLPLHFGKVLSGSHGGEALPAVDIPRFVALHRLGRLDLSRLITDRFRLDEINDAIAAIRAGRVRGRCVVRMDGP